MQVDRSVRCLSSLGNASTSRVLNLRAIALAHDGDPEYLGSPLFHSPVMNSAIILKHRVRSDEAYLFAHPRSVATKVIVPFDRNDLRLGGRSFFFEQRGFQEAMLEVGNYREGTMEHDLEVLRLINGVPSLDPFLLREHLRANGKTVSDCYFAISASDRSKMYEFVAANVRGLIHLATQGAADAESSAGKLVSALLSTEVDEKLEPLRATLSLNGDEFREGVFSWRGFLYYKWCMANFWTEVRAVLGDISKMRPSGAQSPECVAYIGASKRRIIDCVRKSGREVGAALGTYDEAYAGLVRDGKPSGFRNFLLSAPERFMSIGEKIGAMSHLTSFWRFRFPGGHANRADADELIAIFQDFESGFGLVPPPLPMGMR